MLDGSVFDELHAAAFLGAQQLQQLFTVVAVRLRGLPLLGQEGEDGGEVVGEFVADAVKAPLGALAAGDHPRVAQAF